MNRVEASEVKSLADYELARPELRKRLLEIKAARRVAVGDHMTILFENHDTVLYQIQEMLRVEKIEEPKAIKHEIATYNELIGDTDQLGATLLIEYAEPAERDVKLRELLGLESCVLMHVAAPGLEPCRARFDERQLGDERISSVHYVSFPLGPDLAAAVRAGAGVAMEIDHPRMKCRIELSAEQTGALAADLTP